MSFRYEIRLSGAGGQGLILVGKILAEAAAIPTAGRWLPEKQQSR